MRLTRVVPVLALSAALLCGSAFALTDGSGYRSASIGISAPGTGKAAPGADYVQMGMQAVMVVAAMMYAGTAGQAAGAGGASSSGGCVVSGDPDNPKPGCTPVADDGGSLRALTQ